MLRNASPGAFAALLVTHLTGRLSGGSGLTAGEVDARLAGRDAAHRYAAKPWLADEAADRLRSLGDRVVVVDARRADFAAALTELERSGKVPASSGNGAGGVLCDAADAADLSKLADFAARTGCWCVAATAPNAPAEHVEPVWHAAPAAREWTNGKADDGGDERNGTPDGRLDRFRSLVGEWIDRAGA